MANKKPSERYTTDAYKIGTSAAMASGASGAIQGNDYVIVQDNSEATADNQVKVANAADLVGDLVGGDYFTIAATAVHYATGKLLTGQTTMKTTDYIPIDGLWPITVCGAITGTVRPLAFYRDTLGINSATADPAVDSYIGSWPPSGTDGVVLTCPVADIPDGAAYVRASGYVAGTANKGGASLIINTSKQLIDKATAAETSAKRLALTNLFYNGNFKHTGYWYANKGTNAVTTAGTLNHTITTLSDLSGIESSAAPGTYCYAPAFSSVITHMYYVSFQLKPLHDNVTGFGFGDLVGPRYIHGESLTVGEWNTISGVLRADVNAKELRVFHDTASGYSLNDVIYFKELLIIDLTATFGAGYEPSCEACEELLGYLASPFFLGTVDVDVPKRWLPELLDETDSQAEIAAKLSELREASAQIAMLAEYQNSLDGLKTLCVGTPTVIGTITPALPATAKTNYVMRVGLHYTSNRGYLGGGLDVEKTEVFFGGACRKDFADVRFKDESGNVLEHKIVSSGNYDFVLDSRVDGVSLSNSAGALFKDGPYMSVDDGVTWSLLFGPTPAATDVRFIDSSDRLYVFKAGTAGNIKLYISNTPTNPESVADYTGLTEITGDLKDFINAAPIAQYVVMAEDAAGVLYLIKYDAGTGTSTQIWVKEPAGVWARSTTVEGNHHAHSISVDRTVTPNMVYVGLDGVLGVANPCNMRSDDRGATWVALGHPDYPRDYPYWGTVDANGNHYRLAFGETNIFRGPTIMRIIDDTDYSKYEAVLSLRARGMMLGRTADHLFFSQLASREDGLQQIMVSEDEGLTWKSGFCTDIYNNDSVGIGIRYQTGYITPLGATENQIIASSDGPVGGMRIFSGGANDYYAFAYVNVGSLPTAGRTISVECGYALPAPAISPFTRDLLSSHLLFDAPLNEGQGRYALETVSGELIALPKSVAWVEANERYGGNVYPPLTPYRTGGVACSKTQPAPLIANSNIIPNNNFTISFWYKYTPTVFQQTKIFIMGNPEGVHLCKDGIYLFLYDRADASVYKKLVMMMADEKTVGAGDWVHIMITLSNATPPVAHVYINGQEKDQTSTVGTWAPAPETDVTYWLGAMQNSARAYWGSWIPISHIAVFNTVLTPEQVYEYYYGYQNFSMALH